MSIIYFDNVFEEEIEAINSRRRNQNQHRSSEALKQPEVVLIPSKDVDGTEHKRPADNAELIGLALSGGGIRSAAFCLGALQALEERNVFEKIDYLSTVSGGGYIGTSAVSAMSKTQKSKFPFPSVLKVEQDLAIRHIRDHSNYLFPRGPIDLIKNLAIYLRGLFANAITILLWLLIFAIPTILMHPTVRDIAHPSIFLYLEHFELTLIVAVSIVLVLLLWSVERSFGRSRSEVDSNWTKFVYWSLIILMLVAFCELQPIMLAGMFGLHDWTITSSVVEFGGEISKYLIAYSSVIAFFSTFLGKLLKTKSDSSKFSAWFLKILIKAAMYLAAAAIPLLLWVAYLYLSYWGIFRSGEGENYPQTPAWIVAIARYIFGFAPLSVFNVPSWLRLDQPMVFFYIVLVFPLLVFQFLLRPNANSLHRLYRDRLSKAFLFDPTKVVNGPNGSKSFAPLDNAKLSEINCKYTPYQIINAALNIRGSRYANQRGRDADFFTFTPKYTGSQATGYVPTADVERQAKQVDLAAAVAISGAAVSSNMGRQTIKELSAALAIFNVRLGFWLPNPRKLAAGRRVGQSLLLNQWNFIEEILGWLDEENKSIYLTDGGHIENLGIYELLRRRCSLIIAIDAEADPQMSFNSFVAMQRYALIDLGVLVSLPWAEIRDATRECSKVVAETGGLARNKAPHGPHIAIGEIQYPGDTKPSGVLLYIKSSLTGDENDYIVDYKRRYPQFPHETTADQLFSEEQFESYRALGFHATRRAFTGEDNIALASGLVTWNANAIQYPLVERARKLLLG